jgi:regulator of cell morphogenesis and NO signaling
MGHAMTIDAAATTLADLVLERPGAAHVLERLGLDYCCGGRRTLAEACAERGLDAATVAVFLESDLRPAASEEEPDWREAPLEELVAHIVEAHHDRLRRELPRLSKLAGKVLRAHGADRPELREVHDVYAGLRAELEAHVADEEERVFPDLLAGRATEAELEELEREHEGAAAVLARLSELTGGYDRDRARCATHRALLDGLHELELDMHRHVHEENNVLFPRARALGVSA